MCPYMRARGPAPPAYAHSAPRARPNLEPVQGAGAGDAGQSVGRALRGGAHAGPAGREGRGRPKGWPKVRVSETGLSGQGPSARHWRHDACGYLPSSDPPPHTHGQLQGPQAPNESGLGLHARLGPSTLQLALGAGHTFPGHLVPGQPMAQPSRAHLVADGGLRAWVGTEAWGSV